MSASVTQADIDHAMNYLPKLARKCAKKYRWDGAEEELRQEGALAILQSVPRFKPGQGAAFATYAGRRAAGAMLDVIRTQRRWTGLSRFRGQLVAGWVPLEQAAITVADRQPTPYEHAEVDALWRLLSRAARNKRDAIVLRDWRAERPVLETCQRLGGVTHGRCSQMRMALIARARHMVSA